MQVENKARFISEFNEAEGAPPVAAAKPADYRELFKGNTDDCFRCGVRFARKSVRATPCPPPQRVYVLADNLIGSSALWWGDVEMSSTRASTSNRFRVARRHSGPRRFSDETIRPLLQGLSLIHI